MEGTESYSEIGVPPLMQVNRRRDVTRAAGSRLPTPRTAGFTAHLAVS
jgi:hypothetical protein